VTAPTNLAAQNLPFGTLDRLEGVSRDVLVNETGNLLDAIYHARSVFAWCSLRLDDALAFKGFAASRRPYGSKQAELLRRAAAGDAIRVAFERNSGTGFSLFLRGTRIDHHVTAVLPASLVNTGATDATDAHRLTLAAAAFEYLTLRQLAMYEAGVALAHENPSGPKKVAAILHEVSAALETIGAGGVVDGDFRDALAAAGISEMLTTHSYMKELGLA